MVFNHPEHCADPFDPGFECGAGDLFAPGVDASVRCAAANVVGRSVRAGFGARPRTGDDREALTGLGLTNPTQAEIHAVVRTHGPDIPELVHEQIRSCLASPAVASPAQDAATARQSEAEGAGRRHRLPVHPGRAEGRCVRPAAVTTFVLDHGRNVDGETIDTRARGPAPRSATPNRGASPAP